MKLSSQTTVLTLANAIALGAAIVNHARGKSAPGISNEKLEQAIAARLYARVSRQVAATPVLPS